MRIDTNIFKAYDIRGKYPREINENTARRIGRAVARFISKKRGNSTPLRKNRTKILVCRDVRTSSPQLKEALVEGITTQGCEVIDVGIGTTPYFYFLMHTKGFDGGVMITASHNPAEYNGFKIRKHGGKAVSSGKGLEEIKRLVIKNKFTLVGDSGSVVQLDLKKDYLKHLIKGIAIGKMRAVIDAGGGSTAYFLPTLLNSFPQFVYKPLFFEPDGSFKKHPPNPFLRDSQKFIKEELKKGGYRFGAIFDGDGDRVFFFDEKGEFVRPEFVFALWTKNELAKQPGKSFVMTVNTSRAVKEYISENKGKLKISRVGYAFVQDAMKSSHAPLGVEISGHFYFKEVFSDDSGLLALLKLADFLSRDPRPLSKLIEPFQSHVTSGELNYSVKNKEKVMAGVNLHYKKAKKSYLDGITAEFPDWWFNIRPSNTEPLVRVVIEARNRALYEAKVKELENLIKGG